MPPGLLFKDGATAPYIMQQCNDIRLSTPSNGPQPWSAASQHAAELQKQASHNQSRPLFHSAARSMQQYYEFRLFMLPECSLCLTQPPHSVQQYKVSPGHSQNAWHQFCKDVDPG